MVRQGRDGIETHHAGGALDGMDQPECLVDILDALRGAFQVQQRLHEVFELLLRFVHEHLEVLRHLVGGLAGGIPDNVAHGARLPASCGFWYRNGQCRWSGSSMS